MAGIRFGAAFPRAQQILTLLGIGIRRQAALGMGYCDRDYRSHRTEIFRRRIHPAIKADASKKASPPGTERLRESWRSVDNNYAKFRNDHGAPEIRIGIK